VGQCTSSPAVRHGQLFSPALSELTPSSRPSSSPWSSLVVVGASVLYLLPPTRAYAGAAAVVVFLVLLLLELV
jgi:hypothetical protein